MTTDGEESYIDYEKFLSPTFTPVAFANSLVTSTNNASDTTVDLTTPLSKVLFDVQEIDTHIHDLTTKSALPLLQHVKAQSSAASTVTQQLELQIKALTENYQRLEAEVVERHAVAEEVRLAASRLWVTVKIGRAVSRALGLGRALEREMIDAMRGVPGSGVSSTTSQRDDHTALIHAAYTLQTLRALFNATGRDEEGEHLSRINVLNTLRTDLLMPSEQKLKNRAQQIVREFSLSSLTQAPSSSTNANNTATQTNGQQQQPSSSIQTTHESKSRVLSALQTLYLLSPPSPPSIDTAYFAPTFLLQALTTYLQTSLTSSVASLARSLSSLPTLPRALAETSARCQNIVGLEALLAATAPTGKHPLLEALNARTNANETKGTNPQPDNAKRNEQQNNDNEKDNSNNTLILHAPQTLLQPLLQALDTASLPSYFWRSLASALSPRVGEILSRGGVAARSLRAAKERVRRELREAVLAGVAGAGSGAGVGDGRDGKRDWEREVAVVVGSVLGPLGR